ncbi:MAG: hypothetical protein RJB08_985 [Actinomycetota bacterium]|jgi:hypothetical protein
MTGELPNFHIPHMEKIEWMVETKGWAIETVAAGAFVTSDGDPLPTYSYTINFSERFSMPEIVIVGLTPVACSGIFDLLADICSSGQHIDVDATVTGLFDGDQRARFLPIDAASRAEMFATAFAWYKQTPPRIVQLLWPDRNGFLPGEAGFDQRLRFTQPILG